MKKIMKKIMGKIMGKITLDQFKSFMLCYGYNLEWNESTKERYGLK